MTNRGRLRSLTLIALMNAVVVALIAIQMVVPVAFLPLLCIVPTVFGIEAYSAPLRLTLLSCAIVIAVASLGFGPVVGAWAVVYVLVGTIAGLTRRWKWPAAVRELALAGSLLILMVGIVVAFASVAGLSVDELQHQASQIVARAPSQPIAVPVQGMFAVGLAVFVIVFAVAIDRLLSTIVARLPIRVA